MTNESNSIETAPLELGEEMLDLVAGGIFPELDPNG